MSNNDLAVRAQSPQAALTGYNEDQIQQFAELVRRIVPWASERASCPMSNGEVGLVVRRALTMGLDPLNPHEVQIWKDKRGSINFQIAYTLLAAWVLRFHGEHTEPQFSRLTEEQLKAEGLAPKDIAYRVRFIMKRDLAAMREMMALRVFDTHEIRAMFEITGLGVAGLKEYNGQYFAPAARSKSWKVQKRAVTDAYRRKFGTPTKAEIEELRRDLPDIPDLDDLEYAVTAVPHAAPAEIRALAKDQAALRKMAENPLSEEEVAVRAELLYGAVEGEFVEPEPAPGADADIPADLWDSAPEIKPPHAAPSEATRPYSPEVLRGFIADSADEKRDTNFAYDEKADNYRGAVRGNLEFCFAGDPHSDQKRRQVSEYLTGKASSKDWDDAMIATLHNWLNAKPDEGGTWLPDPLAEKEAVVVAKAAALAAGQTEMDLA